MKGFFKAEAQKKRRAYFRGLYSTSLPGKTPGSVYIPRGKVVANDDDGRERLAKYMIRPPILMTRLSYDRENQVVYYRTDKEVLDFEPVEFLARLCVHPNTHEQTVSYMGSVNSNK